MLTFERFTDFSAGTIYDILCDAYSYDPRNRALWDENWRESDAFFAENPAVAEKYAFVTCLDKEPIGFVAWNPRHRPAQL